jgi:hypothetical protein
VSWKWLLVFPLAALIVGAPVMPPRMREPIPEIDDLICDYSAAKENYLLAYAYAREAPSRSLALLTRSEQERMNCAADTSTLRSRILELRTSIQN